jgi:hypothetical protein
MSPARQIEAIRRILMDLRQVLRSFCGCIGAVEGKPGEA